MFSNVDLNFGNDLHFLGKYFSFYVWLNASAVKKRKKYFCKKINLLCYFFRAILSRHFSSLRSHNYHATHFFARRKREVPRQSTSSVIGEKNVERGTYISEHGVICWKKQRDVPSPLEKKRRRAEPSGAERSRVGAASDATLSAAPLPLWCRRGICLRSPRCYTETFSYKGDELLWWR